VLSDLKLMSFGRIFRLEAIPVDGAGPQDRAYRPQGGAAVAVSGSGRGVRVSVADRDTGHGERPWIG
jgi:NaMN:DMB phosphoribosyltransferase